MRCSELTYSDAERLRRSVAEVKSLCDFVLRDQTTVQSVSETREGASFIRWVGEISERGEYCLKLARQSHFCVDPSTDLARITAEMMSCTLSCAIDLALYYHDNAPESSIVDVSVGLSVHPMPRVLACICSRACLGLGKDMPDLSRSSAWEAYFNNEVISGGVCSYGLR